MLKVRIEKGRSWRDNPYWLQLYADDQYVGAIWSEAAVLQKMKQGDYYFLRQKSICYDFTVWVTLVIVNAD